MDRIVTWLGFTESESSLGMRKRVIAARLHDAIQGRYDIGGLPIAE
jgi:hypothetical protein